MQRFKTPLCLSLLAMVAATAAFGQTIVTAPATATAPPSAPAQRSEADLEKLVAPIALYPDPLLATLLPASAYPIDIVQAARFIQDTNNLPQLDSQPWDQNVKALARFPEVLAKLNDDIGWTSELGQAFVADQKAVLDAIQVLRAKAQQTGSLKTTPQQVVVTTNEVVQKTVEQEMVYVTNTIVQIQPAESQVIYVPQYNPAVVYAPAPAYAYDPVAPLVTFGVGLAVGAVIANNCDWHSGGVYVGPRGAVAWGGGYHGDVDVNVNRNVNVNQSVNRNVNTARSTPPTQTATPSHANAQKWQPDPSRRTSAPPASTAQARGWGGQAAGGASAPRAQPAASRAPSAPAARTGGYSAFNSSGGGASARQASARGAVSHGGFRGGGGRRR